MTRKRLSPIRVKLFKLIALLFSKQYFQCFDCNMRMIHINEVEQHERKYHEIQKLDDDSY